MKLSACDCNRGPSIIWTIKPLWNDIWATSFGVWPVSGIQKHEVRHIDFVSTKNRKVFKNTEIQFATYDIPFFDICKLQMQHNSDDASSAVDGWPREVLMGVGDGVASVIMLTFTILAI